MPEEIIMDVQLEGFLNTLGEAERGRVLHELTAEARSLEDALKEGML
jgi:hypothetical protein